MSEVTEGELVMWSVDPGPMAGVLERQLWRMATAARSYLNRMRAAELAHGVMAGERDAVTVERDEALKARITAQRDRLVADHHAVVSSEPYKAMEAERDALESQIEDARDILCAFPAETLPDAARRTIMRLRDLDPVLDALGYAETGTIAKVIERVKGLIDVARELGETRCRLGEVLEALAEARRERDEALAKVADLESMRAGVAYFACWPDGMLEALGATDVSGVADVMERVMALVGAERERDRLLRSEADVCAILGAAPDELLSDAAQRVRNEAGRYQSWVNECALSIGEPKHSNVPDRVAAMARAEVPSGGQIRALQQEAEGARAAMRRMEIDHAAALAVARMDAAEAEPPQVFRPFITVTMCPDRKGEPYASLDVPPIRDPAFLALSGHQLSRLGLVVCDD